MSRGMEWENMADKVASGEQALSDFKQIYGKSCWRGMSRVVHSAVLMLMSPLSMSALSQDLTELAPPSPQKTAVFAGNTQAELTIVPGNGICAESAQLTILRRGAVLLEKSFALGYGDLRNGDSDATANLRDLLLCNLSDLRVLNLDGDAEPEVHVSNFSGGAHCCFSSLVYRYVPSETGDRADSPVVTGETDTGESDTGASSGGGGYSLTVQDWNNASFRLAELDLSPEDNVNATTSDDLGLSQIQSEQLAPEWLSRDDRFAYVFASYAASAYPIQIRRYRQGKFIDVSRDYPEQVYNDAYRLWLQYRELRQRLPLPDERQAITAETEGQVYLSAIRSALAAYMANKYMLGQEADGWQRLEQLYPWRDRPEFITNLTRHLRATGYITGSFTQEVRFFPGGTFDYLSGRLLPGDIHRYQLTAREAQQFQLSLQSGQVQAQLLTPAGRLLAQLSSDSANPDSASIGRPLPQNGTYTLEVTAAAESSYEIFVEIP